MEPQAKTNQLKIRLSPSPDSWNKDLYTEKAFEYACLKFFLKIHFNAFAFYNLVFVFLKDVQQCFAFCDPVLNGPVETRWKYCFYDWLYSYTINKQCIFFRCVNFGCVSLLLVNLTNRFSIRTVKYQILASQWPLTGCFLSTASYIHLFHSLF